ncbi:MAG: RHS repeat-associated core domain-containing protein, partial [Cyanobacteria bacterium P01_H01_bin.58]
MVPQVSLASLAGQVLTSPTDILGTVQDDNLVNYTLSLALFGSDDFREIYRGTETVANGVLGELDTSLFQNDTYTLRLTAEDGNANIASIDTTVDIAGDLKLGNFTLSFTDMELPVPGIPVTVTRTYDSLTANETDDFGYGWRLEFRDTNLRTSLGPDEEYDAFGFRRQALENGTRIYLTLPGGKREGFTFAPEVDPRSFIFPDNGGIDTNLYRAAFKADDGVTSTLSVKYSEYDDLLQQDGNGRFFQFGNPDRPFNPKDSFFGGVYVLTTKDGIEYEIDANTGDLLTAKDLNGNTVTFTDSGIYSDTGVAITFGRDAQGRITSLTDPEGNQVTYAYDEDGDLVAVTDAESYTTQFKYKDDNPFDHYLEEVIDPLGRTGVKSEYDELGRLKRLFDVDGDTVEIDYDPDNSTQIVKDAFGNSTFYEYDSRGNVIQQVDPSGAKTFFEYADPNDSTLVTRVTDDNGNVVDYTYDRNGYLSSRTALHDPSNENPDTTYYSHNKFGQMTAIILPTGASFSMDYDERGNMLAMADGDGNIIQSYKYDAKGRVIEESDPFGTTSYDNPESDVDFDRFGNPLWMKDSLGEVTTMTYTLNGQLASMTDDEGTSIFTYDGRGRETRADYGDGLFVEYGYGYEGDWTSLDSPTIGRIERNFTDDGRLGGWVTADGGELTFTYDAAGRLQTETTPDGRVTRYEYDDVNRTNRVIDEASGLVAETVYDNVGRVASRTQIMNEGTPEEVRNTTSYTYYVDGRMASMTDARGNTWSYEYSALTTTVTDPLGRRTTTVQTENYLPQEVRYADGTTASTEYLFDNNLLEGSDYPTRVIDRGGHDRTFTYDELGRLATATDLGDNTYTYAYFDNGLASITSAEGQVRRYTYDGDDNLESILYGDGTAKRFTYNDENRLSQTLLESGESVSYVYDEVGRVISEISSTGDTVTTTYTDDGRVSTLENSSGITRYTYDVEGNLSGIESPNGSSIRYEHDAMGRLIELGEKATADGVEAITRYGYDAVGNLISVTDPTGGDTVMTYDAVNRLETRTMPNGVTTTYGYNDVDQVISIVHATADGNVIASFAYDREGMGEPSKITLEDGSYQELTYDDSLRLTEEKYYDAAGVLQETITYSYDADGKRTAHSDNNGNHTYSYGDGFQLESVVNGSETESYRHDEDGRLDQISRDGETLNLEHNATDQLTLITNATTGESITYFYDGEGNRIGEQSGSEVTQYLVAPSMGSGLSVQDLVTDGAGNVLANHVYVGASPLMRLDGNGEAVYYLTDAMGSVIGLVDGNGQSVASFDYDGFGNIRGSEGRDAVGEAIGGDYRFQSHWLESESGLYYMRARDYDAQTGQFLSRDPVDRIQAIPESINPYQFVYNNPMVYSDPTGEITLGELNASKSVQEILGKARSYAFNEVREAAIDEAKGIATNVLKSVFNS